MGQEQPGGGEGEQEFDGFGDPHQGRGECQGEQQAPLRQAPHPLAMEPDGKTGAGQTEHDDGIETRHIALVQRLGGGERLQVALPQPHEAAQHLVQAEGDQQPVQHAVAEGAKRRGEQVGGEQGDALLQQRPEQGQGHDQQQAGQGREQQAGQLFLQRSQPAGEGEAAGPGADHGGGQARQQAADHVRMQAGLQGGERRAQQQEVDRAGQGLRPLPLPAQPEGDGHRIDERHLAEQGASGQGEHRQIQHVRLAEPIEQGRQRQDGDG